LLLVPLPAWAADDVRPKGASLTPQEITQGWLLLFDGETTFGWTGGTKWTIAGGMIAPQTGNTEPLVTTSAFSDFELKLQYMVKAGTGKGEVLLGCGADGKPADKTHTTMLRGFGGSENWIELTLNVSPNQIQESSRSVGGFVGFASRGTGSPRQFGTGPIALSGSGVVFRKIQLRPLNLKPLFNGKDLTGWREISGKKSKFTVTKEGWLNIKDGPGDLQTDGQWADFVLQLECISNGPHLNSGVFFRCLPDQFWSGYEAQIRNEWKGDDRTKAVDYGTGGIYNRQPARKVVSSDHEWFTMTVIANGKHLAVWVDGYQTSDYTDERPMNKSARNGCKVDKGPISLQGHDKTTDLSFRNLRIAEPSKIEPGRPTLPDVKPKSSPAPEVKPLEKG
jgi:hypothetical protein